MNLQILSSILSSQFSVLKYRDNITMICIPKILQTYNLPSLKGKIYHQDLKINEFAGFGIHIGFSVYSLEIYIVVNFIYLTFSY